MQAWLAIRYSIDVKLNSMCRVCRSKDASRKSLHLYADTICIYLYNLKVTFFEPAVGSRPNLARMCG